MNNNNKMWINLKRYSIVSICTKLNSDIYKYNLGVYWLDNYGVYYNVVENFDMLN